MTLWEVAYRAAVRGARGAAPLLGRGSSKLARGIRGRADAPGVLLAWASQHRDRTRPLVWLHAPSVGEGLQARAVAEALAAERPDVQLVFTHFSPSAEALAARMPVDAAGYLPWDLPGPSRRVLDALAPSVLAFTKTEVWPTLAREAAGRGVATALVAATLPKGSSRRRAPARWVLAPALARLDLVAAIAEDDARRLVALGTRPERTAVTGDPGVDSAAQRAGAADPDAPWLRPFRDGRGPTLVAGSTWPPDEAVLLPAASAVRDAAPGLRLVVAPHEPDAGHVEPLEGKLRALGWSTARLGEVEARGALAGVDAVVVDRVGVLAQLYTVADVAWVGGGFHDAGLHSVLEPAAAGVPVLFGPRHGNARAAGDLLASGGARAVADAAEAEGALRDWLTDASRRRESGGAALHYIGAHRGAAVRTARRLSDLL